MHTFIFSWCKLNSRQISCFCNKWKAACCTPPWSWSTKIGSVCLPGRNSNTENNSKTAAEIHELQRKWTTSREEKDLVTRALKISREKLKTANATIAAIQHTNFYKQIKRREIALKQKEATVEQRERQCGQRRQRVEELKKKLKTSQTVVSNMRRRLSLYKTRVQANNERHDQQLVDYMTNDEEQPKVRTIVEGGKKQFTPAVVKADIALISCSVSAKNWCRITGSGQALVWHSHCWQGCAVRKDITAFCRSGSFPGKVPDCRGNGGRGALWSPHWWNDQRPSQVRRSTDNVILWFSLLWFWWSGSWGLEDPCQHHH